MPVDMGNFVAEACIVEFPRLETAPNGAARAHEFREKFRARPGRKLVRFPDVALQQQDGVTAEVLVHSNHQNRLAKHFYDIGIFTPSPQGKTVTNVAAFQGLGGTGFEPVTSIV